jgi:hypothetical protein
MIQIITKDSPISTQQLDAHLNNPFTDMVKFVVDLKQEEIALGGELHADAEAELLLRGSYQEDLWGANIYPKRDRSTWIEYTSLINIRPSQNNFGMLVQSKQLQEGIRLLVDRLIT